MYIALCCKACLLSLVLHQKLLILYDCWDNSDNLGEVTTWNIISLNSPAVIDQKKLELFKLVIQARNFHRLLRALREIFSDVGPSGIKLWSPDLRMPRFC